MPRLRALTLLATCVLAASCQSPVETSRRTFSLDWAQQGPPLGGSQATNGDHFGNTVAADAERTVVGAPGHDYGDGPGAAYVFGRTGGAWIEQQTLTGDSLDTYAEFGKSVAIGDDWLAVGAPGAKVGGTLNRGEVFLFRWGTTSWISQGKLSHEVPAGGTERYGETVALSYPLLLVGSPSADYVSTTTTKQVGAAFAFTFDPSWEKWNRTGSFYPDATDREHASMFGASVAVGGNTAVVGETDNPFVTPGSAYVFLYSGGASGTWSKQARLQSGVLGDWYGTAVAVSGNTTVVGAPETAKTYVYTRTGNIWSPQATLTDVDAPVGSRFGAGVAIDGDTLVVGAPGAELAFVFTRSGSTWTRVAELSPSTTVDQFGTAVALQGDLVVVGAPGNDPGNAFVFRYLLPAGGTCGSAGECLTGYCVESKCCTTACTEPCLSCNNAAGTCTTPVAQYAEDLDSTPKCTGDYRCNGAGACGLVNSKQCSADGACASLQCADGRCCNSSCAVACYSCALPGTEGQCLPTPAGTDDDGRCVGGTAPCHKACDGEGSCVYAPTTTPCGMSTRSCTDGWLRQPDHCNGQGTCETGLTESCGGFACADQQSCYQSCSNDAACLVAYHCDTGAQVCIGDGSLGTLCSANGHCQSGHCADGVCCDLACTGNCETCNLDVDHRGLCTQAPVNTDPRHRCQASSGGSAACAGTCDITGQCAFPDVGTVCGLCAACDGTGRCTAVPPDDDACGLVECGGLDTVCRTYQDLSTDRCAALGACKQDNDPDTCTAYADLGCEDGGVAAADAAAGEDGSPGSGPDGASEPDGGTGAGGGAGGCGCSTIAASGRPTVLLLVALLAAPLARPRRRRSRRAGD